MDSLGVLYSYKESQEPRNPTSVIPAELHINYWKIPVKNAVYNRFLDIGLLIENSISQIDTVYFYFPFLVTKDDIEDLGAKLTDSDMFCTFFNGDYTIVNVPNSQVYHEIKSPLEDERNSFWLYELSPSNFELKALNKGVMVCVKIKSLPEIQSIQNEEQRDEEDKHGLYIRFRIKNMSDKGYFYNESVSNDFFQSAFSKTEMMDLRINEKREFDRSVDEDIKSNKVFFRFSKFHFFFVGSSENEAVTGNVNYDDSRLIDIDKWKKYLGDVVVKSNKLVAYHWSKKKSGEDGFKKCSVFLRTVYSSHSWLKISKYVLVVLVLGIIASAIVSTIFYFL